MFDQLKIKNVFAGPEDKLVKKNISVQCFKVCLKPWPNFDPKMP